MRKPAFVGVKFPKKQRILSIACGGYHNIVFSEMGKVFSWGDNSYGQLGTGDYEKRAIPFDITGKLFVSLISKYVNIGANILLVLSGVELSTVYIN